MSYNEKRDSSWKHADQMAENSGKVSGGVKAFRWGLALMVAFLLYMIMTQKSEGSAIDNEFLGDHWNGNGGDWVGVVFIVLAYIFIVGLMDRLMMNIYPRFRGSVYSYGLANSSRDNNIVAVILFAIGFGCIFLF